MMYSKGDRQLIADFRNSRLSKSSEQAQCLYQHDTGKSNQINQGQIMAQVTERDYIYNLILSALCGASFVVIFFLPV